MDIKRVPGHGHGHGHGNGVKKRRGGLFCLSLACIHPSIRGNHRVGKGAGDGEGRGEEEGGGAFWLSTCYVTKCSCSRTLPTAALRRMENTAAPCLPISVLFSATAFLPAVYYEDRLLSRLS